MSDPVRKHIVAVNDTPFQLDMIRVVLEKACYRVSLYPGPRAALEGMAQDAPPDLIITDLQMPDIDGLRFCRLLRSSDYARYNRVPILANSAVYGGAGIEAIVLAAGATAFLESPYRVDALLGFVNDLLEGRTPAPVREALLALADPQRAAHYERLFEEKGFRCEVVSSAERVRKHLQSFRSDVVLLDADLPGAGLDTILPTFCPLYPKSVFLVLSQGSTEKLGRDPIRAGAGAVFPFTVEDDHLIGFVAQATRERSLLSAEHLLIHQARQLMEEREALRQSEQRYFNIVTMSPQAIITATLEGVVTFANEQTARLFGFDRADSLVGQSIADFLPPDELERVVANQMLTLSGDDPGASEYRMFRCDGSELVTEAHGEVLRDAGGNPNGWILLLHDVTERRAAQDALSESEETFRALTENSLDLIGRFDAQGRHLYVNPIVERIIGLPPEAFIGRTYAQMGVPPEFCEPWNAAIQEVFSSGQVRRVELCLPGGTWLDWLMVPERGANGATRAVIGSARDVTEGKVAQETLRNRETLLRKILEVLPVGLWFADRDGKLISANPAGCRIWGAEPRVGIEEYGVFKARRLPGREELKPEDWSLVRTIREGETVLDELLEIDGFDGVKRSILNSTAPILDDDGSLMGAIVVNQDVTEKMQLQEQLVQAQKLESIGRLAGGIAHDFNNLLTGIIGNISLALMDLDPSDPLHHSLTEVNQAADSAAKMTKQLLAYSRKQIVDPKVANINHLVRQQQRMLVRLIGEDVALDLLLDENLGAVRVDTSQFEQVLVNLVVNARDAMPDGGRLIVQTANVTLRKGHRDGREPIPPGDYVLISVRDTGCGMEAEILPFIFEPFFTTKPKEKGTGLGLATAYGIVRQSGGFIEVTSEVGSGSCFTIYLPRVEERVSVETKKPKLREDIPGGTETVLIVEDEEIVRNLAAKVLERIGYRVFSAAGGQEALDLSENYPGTIDLVVTDVVMPGMNGRQVVERLRLARPDIRVLYTSGYTEDVVVHHGVLDAGLHFIGKPYSPKSLATKIRAVLEGAGHLEAR